MRKLSLLALVLSMVFALAACGSGEKTESTAAAGKDEAKEMTIKHEYGEATVKKSPEKVVVFDFGVLDTLDELGVEVTGVPQAIVPEYLEKYECK